MLCEVQMRSTSAKHELQNLYCIQPTDQDAIKPASHARAGLVTGVQVKLSRLARAKMSAALALSRVAARACGNGTRGKSSRTREASPQIFHSFPNQPSRKLFRLSFVEDTRGG